MENPNFAWIPRSQALSGRCYAPGDTSSLSPGCALAPQEDAALRSFWTRHTVHSTTISGSSARCKPLLTAILRTHSDRPCPSQPCVYPNWSPPYLDRKNEALTLLNPILLEIRSIQESSTFDSLHKDLLIEVNPTNLPSIWHALCYHLPGYRATL